MGVYILYPTKRFVAKRPRGNFFEKYFSKKLFRKTFFQKTFFQKYGLGGRRSGGACPPRNLRFPCLARRGGSGGLRPPGISVNYPCLASAPAVPCPRALSPIFFVRKNFRPKNFSAENFFGRKFFRPKKFSSEFFSSVVGPSSVRPSSVRPSSVRGPSVVRPSVRRPSVRRPSVRRPSVVFDSLSIKKRR